MQPDDSTELNELLNALLNGTLTSGQHERLQQLLQGNDAAQCEYFRYLDLHLGLRDSWNEVELELQHLSCDASSETPRVRQPSEIRNWLIVALATIAALVVVWLGIRPHAPGEHGVTPPVALQQATEIAPKLMEPEARLTQAANAELFLEYVPEVGTSLAVDHEYVLLKGSMELTFACGATAIVQSPSVFKVVSSTRLELKVGNCSVHAPEQASGFEVITPQSRIVDLGTRFSVVARETGTSDVQVVEGAVEVHLPQEAEPHGAMLLEGEAIRTAGVAEDSEVIPFDNRSYRRRLPDRVMSYVATEDVPGQGVRELVSVTVQRGGKEYVYPVEQLIGIDVVHFSTHSVCNVAATDSTMPERPEMLLSDDALLTTGLPNFSRTEEAYVPASSFVNFRERNGLAVQFREPVVNRPGPDVVLFEVQSIEYPSTGDSFYVSPIEDGAGLKTHLVNRFDITLNSANARRVASLSSILFEAPVRSVEDFSRIKVRRAFRLTMPFHALAVGIDFSDLGYADGANVPGMFLEDADDDRKVILDPVFIGGFPDSMGDATSASN